MIVNVAKNVNVVIAASALTAKIANAMVNVAAKKQNQLIILMRI
jgi:hypothetical protein